MNRPMFHALVFPRCKVGFAEAQLVSSVIRSAHLIISPPYEFSRSLCEFLFKLHVSLAEIDGKSLPSRFIDIFLQSEKYLHQQRLVPLPVPLCASFFPRSESNESLLGKPINHKLLEWGTGRTGWKRWRALASHWRLESLEKGFLLEQFYARPLNFISIHKVISD